MAMAGMTISLKVLTAVEATNNAPKRVELPQAGRDSPNGLVPEAGQVHKMRPMVDHALPVVSTGNWPSQKLAAAYSNPAVAGFFCI